MAKPIIYVICIVFLLTIINSLKIIHIQIYDFGDMIPKQPIAKIEQIKSQNSQISSKLAQTNINQQDQSETESSTEIDSQESEDDQDEDQSNYDDDTQNDYIWGTWGNDEKTDHIYDNSLYKDYLYGYRQQQPQNWGERGQYSDQYGQNDYAWNRLGNQKPKIYHNTNKNKHAVQ